MIVDKNLLPCPHCGGKAKIEHVEALPCLSYRVFAKCTSCGARGPELPILIDADTITDLYKSFKYLKENPDAKEIDPNGDRGLDRLVATQARHEAVAAELWNRRDDTDPNGISKAIDRGIELTTWEEDDD